MGPMTERFELRLDPETLDRLDSWRAKQRDIPTRSEAIRSLMDRGLADTAVTPITFTPAERLMTVMLADLIEASGVARDINPGLVRKAIYGGHNWGLRWDNAHLFHGHIDNERYVTEVTDILDMWLFLESGVAKLAPADQKAIQDNEDVVHIKFVGFDGNHESEHMSIAHFMIHDLGRFPSFKGRDLNSHSGQLRRYRRMVAKFLPLRPRLGDRQITPAELLEILRVDRD